MKRELLNRWIDALAGSHAHRKGKGALVDDSGRMCCLGVLCDIEGFDFHPENNNILFHNGIDAPPTFIKYGLYGLSSGAQDCLATLNDASDSFTPVIELIKQIVPVEDDEVKA